LAAVDILAQTDHPSARAALARALEHPVRDVRAAAARVFPDRGNPKIVPGLIDAYWSDLDTWVAQGRSAPVPSADLLCESAARLGAAAIPVLIEGLTPLAGEPGRRPQVLEALLRALGRTNCAEAVAPLRDALDDTDSRVRWVAADALAGLGNEEAAAALRGALADPDDAVRSKVVEELGRMKDAAAVAGLVNALADDAPGVRARAAQALERIGDRSAVAALETVLQNDVTPVRMAAAEALGRLGDAGTVSRLRPMLGPGANGQVTELDMTVMTALVRLRDAASLEEIGSRLVNFRSGKYGGDVYTELAGYGEDGIRVLLRLLNSDRRTSTQSEAVKALEPVRRPDVINALKAWKRKQP
jgi:HEAT repeat protein